MPKKFSLTDSVYELPSSGDKLQKYVEGLLSVLEVTRDLAAEQDIDSLLERIIDRACSALGYERASVFLFDEEKQELYTRKVTELGSGAEEIRLSINKGIAGLVARERQIEHVADPYSHPQFDAKFDRLLSFRTRNILAAPLLSWGKNERLLGVLQLLNKQEGTFDSSDKHLLRAFAAHAAIAIDRAILARHYEEKMELLVSLNLAKEIQKGLFPRQLPDIPGYEIAAKSQPADETGGDYYDVIPLTNGETGLVVADVSGHGFGPSLLMATARAMLRGIAGRDPDVEIVLNELSSTMFDDLQHVRRFISLVYGTLDVRQHCFRFGNAGHGPVVLHLNAKQREFRSLVYDDARGAPLGLFEQTLRACAPVELAAGDMILLGTDGIVETRRNGKQFGVERLCDFVLQRCQNPLAQIIDELFDETIAYNETGFPDDDLTLLIVRRQ